MNENKKKSNADTVTSAVAHMYVVIAAAPAASAPAAAAAPHAAAASAAGVVAVDAAAAVAADAAGCLSARPLLPRSPRGVLVSLCGPAVSPALRA